MSKQFATAVSNLKLSIPTTYPGPTGKEYRPFQKTGIDWLTSRFHSLLADEMGLGKTIQAIGAINRLNAKRVLIVCPASVKLNWERELNEWLVDKNLSIHVVNGVSADIPDCNICVINYDVIHHSNIIRQLLDRKWSVLICDEAHYLKNYKSKRTKAILSRKGVARNCVFKWMLTGTPILNRPIELFPMLRTLSPETMAPYTRYDSFAMRFCGGYRDGFSIYAKGASNSEELNQRLKKTFMLRRLETEVARELPPQRYQMIFLEKKNIEKKLSIVDDVDRKTFKHQKTDMDAGELATYRRQLAEKKLELSIDHIKNVINEVGKLVIFTYHRSVLKHLLLSTSTDGFKPTAITGGMTASEKQSNLNMFINDERSKVFIGQIQAAGQGIDGLQTVCNHVLFLEWSWVPGEISQAIKRVHRMKQTKPVLIQFMVWKDSLEEHMMRTALDKLKTIRRTLN